MPDTDYNFNLFYCASTGEDDTVKERERRRTDNELSRKSLTNKTKQKNTTKRNNKTNK